MKDYVLRFDITMNNLERMDLIDSLAHLLHDGSSLSLGHWLWFSQLVVQLPSSANFQNYVDVSSVIKKPVHFDNVRMM